MTDPAASWLKVELENPASSLMLHVVRRTFRRIAGILILVFIVIVVIVGILEIVLHDESLLG